MSGPLKSSAIHCRVVCYQNSITYITRQLQRTALLPTSLKLSVITLSPPRRKICPCDADFHHNSLTTYYYPYDKTVYVTILSPIDIIFPGVRMLVFHKILALSLTRFSLINLLIHCLPDTLIGGLKSLTAQKKLYWKADGEKVLGGDLVLPYTTLDIADTHYNCHHTPQACQTLTSLHESINQSINQNLFSK